MNRIDRLFSRKRENLLSIYFTAGFPALHDMPVIVKALNDADVDLVEVGMPYSDPMADGPTIQASGQKAIKNGMTMELLLHQIESIRDEVDIPIVWMGYLNQVMQYGEEAFCAKCNAVGIDALIIPDLPLAVFQREYQDLVASNDLRMCFLITPQTSEERIRKLDNLSDGFIYMVADSSITGARNEITSKQIAYFEKINAMQLASPKLIGFGISNHDMYRQACAYANGAIIGSAFINMLKEAKDVSGACHEFANQIKGN